MMSKVTRKQSPFFAHAALVLTTLLAAGCGQTPTESQAVSEPPPAAEAHVDEHGVQSIDAEGNIAPFGMASREPVPIREPEAAVVTATESVAAIDSALYGTHCGACHGPDALGVQGLGLNLVESQLVASSSQAELIEFLKAGRAADAPDNVTGVPMPSFVWMSDGDLTEITVYLKSL